MGECSKTSRDAIGSSDWDRIMRELPHAQERAKALIKSASKGCGSPYEDRVAFALQNSSIEEQRSVIRFLTAEGEKPATIHRRMVTFAGRNVSLTSLSENGVPIFVQAVRVWVMTRDHVRQTLSSRAITSTRWTT
ncbi:hypothetical protein TNIN_196221 [Trichonephila inaurata madagascariensis]|uniref:Uncharacterized protein n=1 Tax=Trichonephila inaurata madagascariensis TaxID=2747483 RepID=A0A8X7BQE0_9ARAC|nr:hypothetical protein TNIN_196221 [Trichonephila inaurata madagascariensis]